MSEMDGEDALIPLGDEDDAVPTGPAAGNVDDAVVVGLEVDATGCR